MRNDELKAARLLIHHSAFLIHHFPAAVLSSSRNSTRFPFKNFLMKHKLLDIGRRLLMLLLVVWTVVSLVTILIELVPGDPATAILGDQATPEQLAQFGHRHGLDRPAFFVSYSGEGGGLRWNGMENRYVDYWRALMRGDMGNSFRTDRPVRELILSRYGATIELAIAALLVAISIAIPLGVVAGTNRGN